MIKSMKTLAGVATAGVLGMLVALPANAWWGGSDYYGPWGGGPWYGGYPYGGYGYPGYGWGGYPGYGWGGYPYGGYGYGYPYHGGWGYPGYGWGGHPYAGGWGYPGYGWGYPAAVVPVQPTAPAAAADK